MIFSYRQMILFIIFSLTSAPTYTMLAGRPLLPSSELKPDDIISHDLSIEQIAVPNNSFNDDIAVSSSNKSPTSPILDTSKSPEKPPSPMKVMLNFPKKEEITAFLIDKNYLNFNSNYAIISRTHRGLNYQGFITFIRKILHKELLPLKKEKNKKDRLNLKILKCNYIMTLATFLLSQEPDILKIFEKQDLDRLKRDCITE